MHKKKKKMFYTYNYRNVFIKFLFKSIRFLKYFYFVHLFMKYTCYVR